jgi:hypothetical protein
MIVHNKTLEECRELAFHGPNSISSNCTFHFTKYLNQTLYLKKNFSEAQNLIEQCFSNFAGIKLSQLRESKLI